MVMINGELLKLAAARIVWNRMKLAQALWDQQASLADRRGAINSPNPWTAPGVSALSNSWNNFTGGVSSLVSSAGRGLGLSQPGTAPGASMGAAGAKAMAPIAGAKPARPGGIK